MSDRVLPAFPVVAVEGKAIHDELVDPTQGQAGVRRAFDRHGNQSNVRIGRLVVVHRLIGGEDVGVLAVDRGLQSLAVARDRRVDEGHGSGRGARVKQRTRMVNVLYDSWEKFALIRS